MSKIIYSFNEFDDENLKAYPFYVGFSSGVVIDQRLEENAEGKLVPTDLYVVTSGLPVKTKEELALFLQDFADDLLGT